MSTAGVDQVAVETALTVPMTIAFAHGTVQLDISRAEVGSKAA